MKYLLILLLISPFSQAGENLIKGFGSFYNVPQHAPINDSTVFKIAFDVGDGAKKGDQNNSMNSLARFINMHVAHGVKPDNIQLALVVHGSASVDVLASSEYKERFKMDNKNQSLIKQLLANNTVVYVCGQSATHYKVAPEQLIEGVQMSLSAMTAHAQLQQQGYTLNPF
ncbi:MULTISPECIES: DsrE family protein [unclassified Pseudoalteromonas]|uniref:DsrE family protein n=1 Tax=unclassified Pseudoalteromonas TaxID=194690 RepID=UPI0018CC8D1D|nr:MULTISPECIES: DsrE family protein [unclassified Pseudoalteromonas]MBH0027917.1 DsrE family protein [Pseudoalteromonas sp. SWN29]MBH0037994.1 DsrE family protein [Pseudoalteromonas sp. SWN166]